MWLVPTLSAVMHRQAVSKMQTANAATRKEINWQAQLDALVDARRLLAHHTEVRLPLHPVKLLRFALVHPVVWYVQS